MFGCSKAERRAPLPMKYWLGLILLFAGGSRVSRAQEPAYFVTYSQVLEEPGSLELELNNLTASPAGGNAYYSPTLELEYGAKAWWTTEFYVQGQTTANDSSVFTGFRFENRFRPFPRELTVNPLFYIEYEDINGADRSVLEVVGNDGAEDLTGSNRQAQREVKREVELKLLLSSYARSWNVSENFIAEKNVRHGEPWEFGYALGVSRPLANYATARDCVVCRQNLVAGAEIYGGLGTTDSFGLRDTSHYAGPLLRLDLPGRSSSVAVSPQFGLNGNSVPVLWRFKLSYEIKQARELFAGRAWR
jgi:hypothetical protein